MYNYDTYQNEYFSYYGSSQPEGSIDAVFKTNVHWFFVEFKNGVLVSNKVKDMKKKLVPSLLTFLDTIHETLSYARNHISFILVYNIVKNPTYTKVLLRNEVQESESRNELKSKIVKLAKKEPVFFKLGQYKNVFFKDVYTYNQEQFKDFLQKNYTDKAIVEV